MAHSIRDYITVVLFGMEHWIVVGDEKGSGRWFNILVSKVDTVDNGTYLGNQVVLNPHKYIK